MNVINDNWLFVRYSDDTVRQISVRQAFIDAEHALDPVYAQKLGVDVDNLLFAGLQ